MELSSKPRFGTSFDFAVRQLSLSGMLVETDFEPEIDSNFQLQLQLGRTRWRTSARAARIPRSAGLADGEMARVGLEFDKMDTGEQAQLRSIIETRLKGTSHS